MRLINLHTHTTYCDGKNTIEEMVQAAMKCGFQSIGISSHGPLHFKNEWSIKEENIEKYMDEVYEIKEKYKDYICVYRGMELDYLPGIGFDEKNIELINRLDYYIGSVHCMGKLSDGSMWVVDGSYNELINGINKTFNGSIKNAVTAYYNLISQMAQSFKPPIIGHLDLIKKFNGDNILFDENEKWYVKCALECLDAIKKAGSAIEINTGGMSRGFTKEQYPATFILKAIKEKEIPIIISSDAHSKENIDYKFDEMYELVKRLET